MVAAFVIFKGNVTDAINDGKNWQDLIVIFHNLFGVLFLMKIDPACRKITVLRKS